MRLTFWKILEMEEEVIATVDFDALTEDWVIQEGDDDEINAAVPLNMGTGTSSETNPYLQQLATRSSLKLLQIRKIQRAYRDRGYLGLFSLFLTAFLN